MYMYIECILRRTMLHSELNDLIKNCIISRQKGIFFSKLVVVHDKTWHTHQSEIEISHLHQVFNQQLVVCLVGVVVSCEACATLLTRNLISPHFGCINQLCTHTYYNYIQQLAQ